MKNLILCAFMLLASLKSNCQAWTPNKKAIQRTDTTSKAQYQCWGTTKKGERCKRHVKIDRSFCYQHATTK